MAVLTGDEAVVAMRVVRAELAAYERMLQDGEIQVDANPELAKHAWVRAVVLSQLDEPAEVAERAGDTLLEFQQYLGAVYAMHGVYGLKPLPFSEALMAAAKPDLASLVDKGVSTVASLAGLCGRDEVQGRLRISTTCAVFDDASGGVASLIDDERVGALPVYPAEFVTAVSAGVANSAELRLASDDHGATYWLSAEGESYSVDALPDGRFRLRRESVETVEAKVFVRALHDLVVVPKLLATPGYCYLLAVPAAMRRAVSASLGPNPYVSELRSALPRSGQWCSAHCKYKQTSRGYHIVSSGALPFDMDPNLRVGADAVDEQVERELRDTLMRIDARRRAADSLRGSLPVSPVVPDRVLSRTSGLSMAVAAEPPGRVGFSCVDTVATSLAPSDLFNDAPKHGRRDEQLAARLDAGGPVSDSYFRKADNRYSVGKYLPAVRSESGRVVLLPDGPLAVSVTTGSWSSIDVATGWRTSRMSLRKVKGVVTNDVVVGPMVAARLDCSAAGSVVVGGLRVPGQATVVWFQGATQFTVREPGGSVALSVPVSGAATGPGWLPSTAVAIYGCPYIKALTIERVETPGLLVLKDGAVSKFGLTRTYGSLNVRAVGRVDLQVSTDAGRDGMAMFMFSAGGLRSLEVAGVLVPAVHGVARVVVENWASAFAVNVTAPGKVKVVADFVSDPGALEQKLRPSPDTPTMPQFGF